MSIITISFSLIASTKFADDFNKLFIYIPLLFLSFFISFFSIFLSFAFLSKFHSIIIFTKWSNDELFEIQNKLLIGTRVGYDQERRLLERGFLDIVNKRIEANKSF